MRPALALPVRCWLALCGLSVLCGLPTHGQAQVPVERDMPVAASLTLGDVPDAQKRSRTIAILPLKNNLVSFGDLFAPDAPSAVPQLPDVEAALQRALDSHSFVSIKPVGRVRAELADDAAAQPLARAAQQRYRLGLDLYLGLATARAATSLQEATELYRGIYQDIVDPKPLADAAFMLGVSLIDMGRAAQGHIVLKDAFQVQPDRRFRPNFFPPQVNAALANALVDHRSTGDPLHPYGDNRRMLALAGRLGASALVLASLRQGPQEPELFVAIFSAQRRVIEAELRVPLRDADTRLGAFFSRWLSCAPITQARENTPTGREMRLDTSGSYALYLRQPTRRDFHSVGFGAGTSIDVRPGLEWFARLNMYTSLSDPYQDLLHAFNSVRLMSGVGFWLRRGPWRMFARPALDLHLLGDFVATTNANCKLFGTNHKLCDQSSLSDLQQRVLVGINLAVGTHLHIGRNFFVALQGSASTYFLPLTGTDRLNVPVSAEIGLGYRM